MNDYTMDHVCSFTGTLAPPELIGPVAEGIRAIFYSTGGEITGGSVRGTLRPVGGDWMTIRTDGVGLLDVRSTFETHDHALILVTYTGMVDLGPDGYDRFLRGDLPATARLRISPRFATSHPQYQWLNRLFCVGIGEFTAASSSATYDVYAVK
jgi:hypothetical protein